MRVKSSGRVGYAPYPPKTKAVAALMPDESPASDAGPGGLEAVRQQLRSHCERLRLPPAAAEVATWDEDELRGLEVGPSTDALGLDRPAAARLVSKIRGLLKLAGLAAAEAPAPDAPAGAEGA
mmetsp:Transcript_1823/g.5997  ORF Transcript_1823/g.5997 Transcript_1823/m.5997 type:complete len:123 (+) Transcript_1823:86-454(+)